MGHLVVEAGPVSKALADFQKSIPHMGLPCSALLNTGEELSPISRICHALWEACPFLKRNKGGIGGGGERRDGKREERGNCRWNVK